jgi:polyphosphate kinase
VRSIVGRFLEHSRVMAFEAGDTETYYIGSADLMPRNLDHRIEVLTPIKDSRIREELSGVLDVLLADDTAWVLGPDGAWTRSPAEGGRDRSTQQVLMRRARLRARRSAAART